MDQHMMKEQMELQDKLTDVIEPLFLDINKNYDIIMVSLISLVGSTLVHRNIHDEEQLHSQLKRTLQTLANAISLIHEKTLEELENSGEMDQAHPTLQ
jgi:hypothetical protein